VSVEPRKHVWFEHKDRCPEPGDCLYCDGGIKECVTCSLAEGELTAECPGYKVNACESGLRKRS
jgi:hypothetical protein